MTPSHIGKYEVQRRLGRGGMGSVYLARDPGLDRLVAIKLLRDEYLDEPELRERFVREARSVARLRHRNIIVVYEIGEDDGRPFIVMEYLSGETLEAVLRRTPSLPLERRLSLVEDLCDGLAHAHAANIIHRDIKPANLMLDTEGVLKILDFGIARLGGASTTKDGVMMGTFNYMSPEQVVGRGVDKRSDIFAAGVVLYEVIALEKAFPGRVGRAQIDFDVLNRIVTEGPPPIDERIPGIDSELARVVHRAIERDPAQRYDDASVLRRDLARIRRRLLENDKQANERGATVAREGANAPPPTTPESNAARRPDSDRQRRLDPARFAELRRQQVEEHLRSAEEAFAREDHDAALHHAERAATVDGDSRAAFDLIDKARFAIEAKAIRRLLAEARRMLSEGHVDDAATLANETSVTLPDVEDAAGLRGEIRDLQEQIGIAREREQRIAASLERARTSIDGGGYETALRAIYEVLALDPERQDARELEQLAKAHLQTQREHEQARRSGYERLERARTLASAGQYDEALEMIGAVVPASDSVRLAAAEAAAAVGLLQRKAARDAIVAQARLAFEQGQFPQALTALNSIPTQEETNDTKSLRRDIETAIREQRELEQKRRTLEETVATVQSLIESHELTRALERLEEVSRLGLDDDRLRVMRERIAELNAAAQERRRQEARERLAAKRVEAARQLLANGDGYAAIALLERDGSGHGLVDAALQDIRAAVAEHEMRARQEAERKRLEREAQHRAELEEQRKAAEKRRLEEERARQQRHEAVATLLSDAEDALSANRPDEATVLLRRADETVASIDDSELRRRLTAVRKREAEAREFEQRLDEILARARKTPEHEAALLILNEAVTFAPADARVQTSIQERRAALERQRAQEERRLEEARQLEQERREKEARRLAEARKREQESRQLEDSLTELLTKARATEAHDAALTLLSEAQTLAPGDARVETLVADRRAALADQLIAEKRLREAAAAEATRRTLDRLARGAVGQTDGIVRHVPSPAGAPVEPRERAEVLPAPLDRHRLRGLYLGAGACLVAIIGVVAWVVLPLRSGPTTAQPTKERQVAEGRQTGASDPQRDPSDAERKAQQEQAQKLVEKQRAAEELAAKQKTAEGLSAKQKAAADLAAKEKAAADLAAKQKTADDLAAKQKAADDLAAKQKAADDLAAKQKVADDPAAKQKAADDLAAKQRAADDLAARQKVADDLAAKQNAAADLAARDQALKAQAARDRTAIEQLLRDYVDAYGRMDEARLKAIDPTFRGIASRELIKSVELVLAQPSIAVSPDGLSATLSAAGRYNYEWRNRPTFPATTTAQLKWSLRKMGQNWSVVVP